MGAASENPIAVPKNSNHMAPCSDSISLCLDDGKSRSRSVGEVFAGDAMIFADPNTNTVGLTEKAPNTLTKIVKTANKQRKQNTHKNPLSTVVLVVSAIMPGRPLAKIEYVAKLTETNTNTNSKADKVTDDYTLVD